MVIGMTGRGVRVARYTGRRARVKTAIVIDLAETNQQRGDREMITPPVGTKKEAQAEE
jgi:hypothetical protein